MVFRFTSSGTGDDRGQRARVPSSSPAVLQRLVRVIVAMGPYASFVDEVSDFSELTMQLLSGASNFRRCLAPSSNVRAAQLASLGSETLPAFPRWNLSANQLGGHLIDADKRGTTVPRGIWTHTRCVPCVHALFEYSSSRVTGRRHSRRMFQPC